MPRIEVNPDAEVSSFETVQAGVYPMKIEECEIRSEKADGSPCNGLKIRFVHTLPSASINAVDGKPLSGTPTSVIAYPSLESDKQGMLKSIVTAAGLEWEDLDTDDLVGIELDVQIKVEQYQGNDTNKFGRAIQMKAAPVQPSASIDIAEDIPVDIM